MIIIIIMIIQIRWLKWIKHKNLFIIHSISTFIVCIDYFKYPYYGRLLRAIALLYPYLVRVFNAIMFYLLITEGFLMPLHFYVLFTEKFFNYCIKAQWREVPLLDKHIKAQWHVYEPVLSIKALSIVGMITVGYIIFAFPLKSYSIIFPSYTDVTSFMCNAPIFYLYMRSKSWQ